MCHTSGPQGPGPEIGFAFDARVSVTRYYEPSFEGSSSETQTDRSKKQRRRLRVTLYYNIPHKSVFVKRFFQKNIKISSPRPRVAVECVCVLRAIAHSHLRGPLFTQEGVGVATYYYALSLEGFTMPPGGAGGATYYYARTLEGSAITPPPTGGLHALEH
jgi:hypothetical protein